MVSIHDFQIRALLGRAEDGTLSMLQFDLQHDGVKTPQWLEAAILVADSIAQADDGYFSVIPDEAIENYGRPKLARARVSQVMSLMNPEPATTSESSF